MSAQSWIYFVLPQANRHLQELVSAQGQEVDGLRDQVRKARGDLRTASIQLTDLTSMKDTLEKQCKAKVSEKSASYQPIERNLKHKDSFGKERF